MTEHALSFKVLRLRPPAFETSDQSKFNFSEDVAPGSLLPQPSPGNNGGPFANRAELSQLGVSGTLVLPQNFGTVYLGQSLSLAITLTNHSQTPVNNVGIRIEIQSDHGKAVLYDSMPTRGLPILAPGEIHELTVKHDIRDLGAHTLLCSSAYTTPTAPTEPRYYPQAFKFQTLNPLVVRTKHRAVGGAVFLEATIENRTHDAMFLESVELATAAGYRSESISNPVLHQNSIGRDSGGPLGNYIAALPVLNPGGGAASYVFRLDRIWQSSRPGGEGLAGGVASGGAGSVGPVSPRSSAAAEEGSALGKLDIRWKGPMGDPARLQTQVISGPPRPQKDLRLAITKLPSKLAVARQFELEITVVNSVDRRMGPLKLSYRPPAEQHGPTAVSAAAAAHGTNEGIVLDGLQSMTIDEIAPKGQVSTVLQMLPRESGRQYLQGIILTDERDGKVLDSLMPIEVSVD